MTMRYIRVHLGSGLIAEAIDDTTASAQTVILIVDTAGAVPVAIARCDVSEQATAILNALNAGGTA